MTGPVLIIGATGKLGAPVARCLAEDGYTVRALVRDPLKAKRLLGTDVELIQGDLFDDAALSHALAGCDAVHINLAAGSLKPRDIDRVEHQGTARVAHAAAKAKLRRITYLSGGSTADQPILKPARGQPMTSVAKSLAEHAIRSSGVPYSIFRSTMYMETLPTLIRRNTATLIGPMPKRFHWIAASDYARQVSQALNLPEAANKVFYIQGPEAFSMAEALAIYKKSLEPQLTVRTIPLGMISAAALLPFSALKELRDVMRLFNKTDERGNPAEANAMLGQPTTTLEMWCERSRG